MDRLTDTSVRTPLSWTELETHLYGRLYHGQIYTHMYGYLYYGQIYRHICTDGSIMDRSRYTHMVPVGDWR